MKDTKQKTVIVAGSNYSSSLCMARSLGRAGYKVKLYRLFQGRPKLGGLMTHLRPESHSKYVDGYRQYIVNDSKEFAEMLVQNAQQGEKQLFVPIDDLTTSLLDENYNMLKEYYIMPNISDTQGKINELMSVSDKIVRDAIDDPSDVPQIRKFLDYYLPTTIKLLNAYDRMNSQEISGSNITGSMQRIEDMLDTAIDAYKRQLDALFANQAADIQMDIEVMNGMLAREGLGGKSYLDINEFMKKYEQQQKYAQENDIQKGSTSNG